MEYTLPNSRGSKFEAAKIGVIWAIINVAIFLAVYYSKPDLMGSFMWGGLQFLISLGLGVLFCFMLRKKVGGYWTFKEALSLIFLMFFTQAVIVFFFTIVFGKLEPTYVATMKSITTETTTNMMEKMGVGQEEIDEALEKNEAALEKQFNPGFSEIAMGVGIIAIMYFVGALIFAALFKREYPQYSRESLS